jgi:hypothetical protein
MSGRLRFSIGIALTLTAPPTLAGERIEPSFFPSPQINVDSRWLIPYARADTDPELANTMVAETDFTELRLPIPPVLVGRSVRILLVLPAAIQGTGGRNGLEVEWKTQSVFRAGSARPGDRVLFFEGPVSQPLLSDLIAYTFRIDARYSTGRVRFEPEYEIEEQ